MGWINICILGLIGWIKRMGSKGKGGVTFVIIANDSLFNSIGKLVKRERVGEVWQNYVIHVRWF